jgi:hypothetical protein
MMLRRILRAAVPFLALTLMACAGLGVTSAGADRSTSPPVATSPEATPAFSNPESYDPIALPISVYILDDKSGALTSSRTVEELEAVYEKVDGIWAQAGIRFEVRTSQRVSVPHALLQDVVRGRFGPFFNAVGQTFDLPDPSMLNAFYAREIGGPNGITPSGSRLFFVNDRPSVHDERVTSHEIGHILGLHHTLLDTGRLLYPGTNGMALTDEEITVARYVAQGLLDGLR